MLLRAVYECGNQQYSHLRRADPADIARRQRRAFDRAAPSTYCSYQHAYVGSAAVAALPALATAWQRRDVGTGVVVTDNSR